MKDKRRGAGGFGHPVSPTLAQFLQTKVTSWSSVGTPAISQKLNLWKTTRISPLYVSRWGLNINWPVSRRKQIFQALSLNLTYPFRSALAEATGWLRIFNVVAFSPANVEYESTECCKAHYPTSCKNPIEQQPSFPNWPQPRHSVSQNFRVKNWVILY